MLGHVNLDLVEAFLSPPTKVSFLKFDLVHYTHCSTSSCKAPAAIMVNPGSFTGRRKEFLDSQKEIYATAVAGAHVADTVADIQRRYFKHFPITLLHTQEPTQESLDAVDDHAPDPELLPPQVDGLSPEAAARAARVYELQKAELKMRKDVRIFLLIILAQFLIHILASEAAPRIPVQQDKTSESEARFWVL